MKLEQKEYLQIRFCTATNIWSQSRIRLASLFAPATHQSTPRIAHLHEINKRIDELLCGTLINISCVDKVPLFIK